MTGSSLATTGTASTWAKEVKEPHSKELGKTVFNFSNSDSQDSLAHGIIQLKKQNPSDFHLPPNGSLLPSQYRHYWSQDPLCDPAEVSAAEEHPAPPGRVYLPCQHARVAVSSQGHMETSNLQICFKLRGL